MNKNLYFTYWIQRYGKEEFKKLTDKVCKQTRVPLEIKQEYGTDDYLFHYFFAVYCIITLNYFGLSNKQIAFILDLSIGPGISKLFPPGEILEEQKDAIPDMLKFIKKDLELYY